MRAADISKLSAAVVLAVALLAAGAPDTTSNASPAMPAAGGIPFGDVPLGPVAVPTEPGSGIRHVIAISIDGLRPDAITELGDEKAPNLHRLMREGAFTLNARNLLERTITLPNHSGMITGQRVNPDKGGMGVTFNLDNGRTIHRSAGRYVASVFDVVHDSGGSTGLYVGKPKFDFLDRSWNEDNGAEDVTGADDGPDKIDTYVRAKPDAATAALVQQLSSADPYTFSFLHLPQPDVAGHATKWMSRRYLAAVEDADRLVGEVLATIDASSERSADTVVIVTTDHGGTGPEHSVPFKLKNYRVFFMVWGPDVAVGADLYALNPRNRIDPGRNRTSYTGVQPIRNGEVANLVTDLLGEPAVPGSLFDREQDLNVFPLE